MKTPEQFAGYRRELWQDRAALAYLRGRGLTLRSIREWRLGYGQPIAGRPPGFVFPVPPRRPVTFRVRHWPELWTPPGGKAVKYAGPVGQPVRFWPDLPSGGQVLLTEGEFDAALALQAGLRAIATPGMQIKAELAEALGRAVDRVPTCFDVGPDADAAADRAVALIEEAGAEAWPVRLTLPHRNDDLGDWFVKYGRTPEELLRLVRSARP